jgi:hypothetical protein
LHQKKQYIKQQQQLITQVRVLPRVCLGIDVLRVMLLTFVGRLQATSKRKVEIETGVMSQRASCWLDSMAPSPEDFSHLDLELLLDYDEVLV